MDKPVRVCSAFFLALALLVTPALLCADTPDALITTKAKIKLLTTKGVSGTEVGVDTDHGKVTLHGKVPTKAEKTKAEAVVRQVGGVKDVDNLLQVVPEAKRPAVDARDDQIEKQVNDKLKAKGLHDVKVASVDKGLVLLKGETPTLLTKLSAIETAYEVDGVKHVSSEIKTEQEKQAEK